MLKSDFARTSYDQVATCCAEKRDQASSIPYLQLLDARLTAESLVLELGCAARCALGMYIPPDYDALARDRLIPDV